MAEERVGGVFIEAYVKGVEEAERRLRDLEARASAVGVGGAGGGGTSGGGGYHVGGTTGGAAPPSGGGFHVGSSRPPTGDPLRSNALLDDVFWGPQSPAGAPVPGGGRSGGGPPADTPVGTFGGWGGGRSKPPSMSAKWIDTSKPDTSPAGDPANVGLMQSMRSQAQKALEKAGENAGEKLGLRAAWVLRSASGGGALGAVGGGLGALAGLAIPAVGPSFAALIGNMAGREAGDQFTSASARMDRVGVAFPGLGYQRQRAEADAEAAESRAYIDTYKRRTGLERKWADFYASGGRSIGGTVAESFEKAGQEWSKAYLNVMGFFQGVAGRHGSSSGAAQGPLLGKTFGGGDDLYKSFATFALQHQAREGAPAAPSVNPASLAAPGPGSLYTAPAAMNAAVDAYMSQSAAKLSSDVNAAAVGGWAGWLFNQVLH